jgi:carboxymethylenebutenolidase
MVTTMGRYIDISSNDGGTFSGYLAEPSQGSGPGLVLLQEIFGINDYLKSMADQFAEEGYVVLVPDLFWRMQPDVVLGYSREDFSKALAFNERFDDAKAIDDIRAAIHTLRATPAQQGRVGAVGYCLGGRLVTLAAATGDLDCAISYYGVGLDKHVDLITNLPCPMAFHIAENDALCPPPARAAVLAAIAQNSKIEQYVYPGCDHAFATPGRDSYDKPAAMMAYSRTLALLRKVIGPIYDQNSLWEAHCYHEFVSRDVDAIMPTMVAQPYVNHVPTMTGGVGHDELKRFYKYHFVNSNPDDTRMIPLSRTIGSDRVVDEFIFCCTHDREIDWLLPGLAPTGKYFEIPMLAVICFRGDKLYNEHIYWDQASVLVQIGALDPTGLPVAGIQSAKKMIDESLPTNQLMAKAWASSEGKKI